MRLMAASLLLAGCSVTPIEQINIDVNRYPYCSDAPGEGQGDINVKGCGDCEDYALEKCKRLRAAGYRVDMVYRPGHEAIAVDGTVLDNNHPEPYPLNINDWTLILNWECL